MIITRKRLNLNSLAYSREFDVDRSDGCHLMTVVEYIGQTSGIEKKHKGNVDLEPYATAGFLWEHVMIRERKIEHAMSVEAIRMEMQHRAELTFPGERFWCRQCDRFMRGGRRAKKHCRRLKHKGIFFTPDAFDTSDQSYVEFKFSWKSSRKSRPKVLESKDGIWRWPVQCGFNALGLGVDKAKLIALHCNGNYAPGLPNPKAYEITMQFDRGDFKRIKRLIVENAIDLGWI